MTTTAPAARPERMLVHDPLTGRRLPRWHAPALVVAALLLAVALNLVTPIQGTADTLFVAVLCYLALQTIWSLVVEGSRHARSRLATTLLYGSFLLAFIPLVAILLNVALKGLSVMSVSFITQTMRNVTSTQPGGGIYAAMVGTIEIVGIAALIAVPIGLLVAVYLTEFGRGRLALAVSFIVDVMTGVPSIVAGLFIYSGVILVFGTERTGFMGSLALAILMIPIVVRSAEEMLRLVPKDLREASMALGVPHWKTVLKVVIPTALGGIVTGVMLAVARVAGETAPLLLTVFLSQSINYNPFQGAQATIPTFVWEQLSLGTDAAVARAWAGALTLIVMVMLLNIAARLIARLWAVKE
jgi:phosphate transport system permease protein